MLDTSNPMSGDSVNMVTIVSEHYQLDNRRPMVGAEIGVHEGFLSATLLKHFPNLLLFMIDIWPDQSILKKAMDATDFAANRRVVLHTRSHDAAGIIQNPLDWTFIDGDHSHPGASMDLLDFWPKVKSGGIQAGHDYKHPVLSKTPNWGVEKAVEDFAAWTQLPLKTMGLCWWFEKP